MKLFAFILSAALISITSAQTNNMLCLGVFQDNTANNDPLFPLDTCIGTGTGSVQYACSASGVVSSLTYTANLDCSNTGVASNDTGMVCPTTGSACEFAKMTNTYVEGTGCAPATYLFEQFLPLNYCYLDGGEFRKNTPIGCVETHYSDTACTTQTTPGPSNSPAPTASAAPTNSSAPSAASTNSSAPTTSTTIAPTQTNCITLEGCGTSSPTTASPQTSAPSNSSSPIAATGSPTAADDSNAVNLWISLVIALMSFASVSVF